MAVSFPSPARLALTTSIQTLMTVDSTAGLIFRDAVVKVVNYTDATRLVYVYGVLSGATAGTGNAEAEAMSVPARDYVLIPVSRLTAGASIQAKADQSSALTISLESGNYYTA